MNRIIRIGLGTFFLILGVISIFLPFLPGVLFILVGLVLFGNERARKALHNARHHLAQWLGPRAARWILPHSIDRKIHKKNI